MYKKKTIYLRTWYEYLIRSIRILFFFFTLSYIFELNNMFNLISIKFFILYNNKIDY